MAKTNRVTWPIHSRPPTSKWMKLMKQVVELEEGFNWPPMCQGRGKKMETEKEKRNGAVPMMTEK